MYLDQQYSIANFQFFFHLFYHLLQILLSQFVCLSYLMHYIDYMLVNLVLIDISEGVYNIILSFIIVYDAGN